MYPAVFYLCDMPVSAARACMKLHLPANGQPGRSILPDCRKDGREMTAFDEIQKRIRAYRLKRMLAGEDISARRLNEAVDLIISQARHDLAAGVRKDKVLFAFESTFEKISDEIARLRENGDTVGFRDIYAKIYCFAEEMMADGYMPLYLFIMYRYAGALLETGEAAAAAQMFGKLCAGTDRLIGIRNTYGIHCLERLTEAAIRSGRPQTAMKALEEMNEISDEEFGESGAVPLAVRLFTERAKTEIDRCKAT